MFQYACARGLQDITSQKIVINIYEMNKYENKRKPTLQKYLLNGNIEFTDNPIPRLVSERFVPLKILRKISAKTVYNILRRFGMIVWYGENYVDINVVLLKKYKNIFLGGYWQSERYFSEVIEVLRNELIPKEIPDEIMIKGNIIENQDSVCMHIRRGDYSDTVYQVCTLDYYNKAIKEIKKYTSGIIYVFSDDIEWARENLENNMDLEFISNGYDDFLELYLMSKCNHFVLSNSSFSWWAQELSMATKKLVIAPNKWRLDVMCKDIYKSDWITLST